MTSSSPSGATARTVTALFRDTDSVERAYEAAVDLGYEIGDVNIVMSEDTRRQYYADENAEHTEIGKKSAEGGELGGPAGGRIGLAIPVVAAIGAALVIPGLGLAMAGPIGVALAGAGAAGLAAGLIGSLADWGLPEERVRQYEAAVKDGGILIGVQTRSGEDAAKIAARWRAIGGEHVHA